MSDKIETAIEKALLKTEPDKTPQSSAFLNELHRTSGGTKKNWLAGLLLDGRAVRFTDDTVRTIALAAYPTVASPDELAKLQELQKRMEAILTQAAQFSLANVDKYLFAKRDEMAAAAESGKLPDVVVTPSREAVSRDFIARQRALNGVLVKITHEEVVPLCLPIIQRFNTALETFLRETEESDAAQCEDYGLEYHPSVLWKAGAAIAQKFASGTRMPIASVYRTPTHILEGIVKL